VLRLDALHGADLELLAAVVRSAARARGVGLRRGGTRAAVAFMREGRSGGRVAIGGTLQVSREYGHISIGPETRISMGGTIDIRSSSGEGRLDLAGRRVRVRWRSTDDAPGPDSRIAVALGPGHFPLEFRGWRPGDRIRLASGTKKLKRLFADRRIPVSDRSRLPVLADGRGNVLWIDGLAVAESRLEARGRPSYLELELRDE